MSLKAPIAAVDPLEAHYVTSVKVAEPADECLEFFNDAMKKTEKLLVVHFKDSPRKQRMTLEEWRSWASPEVPMNPEGLRIWDERWGLGWRERKALSWKNEAAREKLRRNKKDAWYQMRKEKQR